MRDSGEGKEFHLVFVTHLGTRGEIYG